MSSQSLVISSLLLACIGLTRAQYSSNSVYDDSSYNSYNYGYYDHDIDKRQDSLDLGNLTFPMLVTAFLAAFFASLIGSTLAGNLSNMLSMEFKVPQGIQVKALPAVRIAQSGETRELDNGLKAISNLFQKYEAS